MGLSPLKVFQVDFVYFQAYNSTELATLIENSERETGVSALSRGGGFDFWTGGTMTPLGSRIPTGGRAGDCYTAYQGIDASTPEAIRALFGHAQVQCPWFDNYWNSFDS